MGSAYLYTSTIQRYIDRFGLSCFFICKLREPCLIFTNVEGANVYLIHDLASGVAAQKCERLDCNRNSEVMNWVVLIGKGHLFR